MNLFSAPAKKTFELRPYQKAAVSAGIQFLSDPLMKGGAIEVLPTGSGKSLVIAGIINGLDGKTIVLQPSKEILEQNYDKLLSYGFTPGVYSASVGRKEVRKITFAMIGSVINNKHLFKDFQHVIIDECHLVNPKGGMYASFIESLEKVKVLGLTATPYRLGSSLDGAILKFLTRTKPRIFGKVIYYIQNGQLFKEGYLAKLKYYDIAGFDRNKLKKNSTGADYTDVSLKNYYKHSGFRDKLVKVVERLCHIRKNVLVFTRFVEESRYLVASIPNSAIVTGETPKKDRECILGDFKSAKIKCVCNVGVLTTGFDYPELESVVIARPTLSLSLYYQMVGRTIRIHPDKNEAFVVDLCDNIKLFGHVEDLVLTQENNLWVVKTGNKQLTNVPFSRDDAPVYNGYR